MGQRGQLHDALYRAWNEDNMILVDEDKIADFVAQHGVDRAKFMAAYDSFTVQSKVARAKQMIRIYGIDGTPTLIVDGKYKIEGLQPEDTIRALKEVIVMARKNHRQIIHPDHGWHACVGLITGHHHKVPLHLAGIAWPFD